MSLTTLEIVLVSGLGFFFLLQLFYFLYYLGRPMRYYNMIKKGKITPGSAKPEVSVIICAQNESENLKKFLPSVLEQDYPTYEVIVINEGSSDESDAVLGALETKYKHLYRTYSPQDAKLSRKKLAITIGIKAAKYDTLLFTEADCEPASKNWIEQMVRHFNNETSFVIGYGAFHKRKGLIGKLSVFDNLVNSLRSFSIALKGKPYTATGRNLSYQKNVFMQVRGFQKHLNLQAGEDDLFVNAQATSTNAQLELSPESVTWMDLPDFRTWKEIKVKQITTRKYYKGFSKALWNLEGFTRLGFWGFACTCIALYLPEIIIPSIAGFIILVRWVIQSVTINKASAVLQGGEKFYWSIPLLDIAQPLFNLYFHIYHIFRGKSDYTWKI